MAKTLPGDFKVTTSENPLLSKQAVTNKAISVPYINLQLNSYPNTNWTCSVVTISPFQCTTLNTWLTNLQSCDLQLCFMLALFHDKKCYNCFNFIPCILWDFIVLGLVLSWWKLKLNWRQCISQLAREKFVRRVPMKRACEEHMTGSWKVMSGCYFRECLTGKAFPRDSRETFCLEDF